MLTLKELQDRLGMNEWPVRRLLDAIAPLLQDQLHRKPGQSMQVDSSALGLLDRAKELVNRGTTRSQLVEILQGEMQGLQRTTANPSSDVSKSQQTPMQPNDELFAELRRTIERLESDNDWLKARLEEQASQLQAMLPATTDSRQRIGRLQALRIAVLGR